MIHGIPNEVGQGILDGLNDGPIELGFVTLHGEAHLLAELLRDVADDPGKTGPDVTDGLHAGLHDPLLQFSGNDVQALGGGGQAALLNGGAVLHNLIAGKHELPDEIHELVELLDAHPNGAREKT